MTDESTIADPDSDLDWLPAPGEIVAGKYEVERVLGYGGMGVVVAAKHAQLGNRVAIKYLRPDLVEEESAMARFTREAKAAVALRGEHVARVQDVGVLDSGAPYMIMEFLTGTDLDAVLEQEGTLGIEEAVEFLLQACEAIAEAHSLGIVHRDLKPANLCLTQRPDGSPLIKVLDFGIAKALESDQDQPSNLTQTGTALGTPMYMSPEQIRDAKAVDPRTDIWALGTVLHQLLVGEPPFIADTLPALCAKIVADPPASLAQARSDVPAELCAVVERCLEKPQEDRYQNVAELAQALEPFAPARATVHVERIVRIVEGRSSGIGLQNASDSGRWRAMDAVAATMASSEELDSASAPELVRPASDGADPAGDAKTIAKDAKQTAAAWQADTNAARLEEPDAVPGRRRLRLFGAIGVALAVVALVAVWVITGADPAESQPAVPANDTNLAATTTPEAPPPQTAADETTSAAESDRTDAGGGGASAATAAGTTAATTSRPTASPHRVPSTTTARPPTTTRPPTKANHGSALSDRK